MTAPMDRGDDEWPGPDPHSEQEHDSAPRKKKKKIAVPLDVYPEEEDDERIAIRLPNRLSRVIDETIAALATLDLFQRGGTLADIVRDPKVGDDRVVLPAGLPKIRLIPFPRIREIVSDCIRFERKKSNGKGETNWRESAIPNDIVPTVTARGEWSGIRPLEGLVSWPLLRPDGTISLGPGYDLATQTFATVQSELDLPPCITPEVIRKAHADIDDLIGEFPFETPAHKAAWVSGLLTVIARQAIPGPIPLLIIDASSPGSGKTALADTLGSILMGATLPRRAVPKDDEEWRKAMLGIGIGAYPLILLDNLKGTLRSAVLDAVLTGTEFQDRALGLNMDIKVKIPTLFVLTTNNATLDSDLVRRSVHCRINVDAENPESRTGFRYDLPFDASKPEIRKRLISAACAILVGYEQAGRPTVECRHLGSYDAWCRAVQHPLVWAGFADPVTTQDELREQADSDGELHGTILSCWFNMYGQSDHTLGTVLSDLTEDKSEAARELASSLGQLGHNGRLPDAKSLGYKLRKWRDKRCNSLKFVAQEKGKNGVPWGVRR